MLSSFSQGLLKIQGTLPKDFSNCFLKVAIIQRSLKSNIALDAFLPPTPRLVHSTWGAESLKMHYGLESDRRPFPPPLPITSGILNYILTGTEH
jgi:hypothetical protein